MSADLTLRCHNCDARRILHAECVQHSLCGCSDAEFIYPEITARGRIVLYGECCCAEDTKAKITDGECVCIYCDTVIKSEALVAFHKDLVHTMRHDFVHSPKFASAFWRKNLPQGLRKLEELKKNVLEVLDPTLPGDLSNIVVDYVIDSV